MFKNTSNDYGTIAKSLHWILFILLTIAVILGIIAHEMPKGPEKYELISIHKSVGTIILLLVLFRLFWRLINLTPKSNISSPIQEKLSTMVHYFLYFLMFLQPFTGVLMSQFNGYPVSVFEWFELPELVSKNEPLANLSHQAHAIIWILMTIVVVGHIGAALYHHFIAKDDVLKKMLCNKKVS